MFIWHSAFCWKLLFNCKSITELERFYFPRTNVIHRPRTSIAPCMRLANKNGKQAWHREYMKDIITVHSIYCGVHGYVKYSDRQSCFNLTYAYHTPTIGARCKQGFFQKFYVSLGAEITISVENFTHLCNCYDDAKIMVSVSNTGDHIFFANILSICLLLFEHFRLVLCGWICL